MKEENTLIETDELKTWLEIVWLALQILLAILTIAGVVSLSGLV